ncbi:MAG: radical SAM protein [Gorillibacterium sp.]|nr:radical SAM protein [Gorillibacterium sp.]
MITSLLRVALTRSFQPLSLTNETIPDNGVADMDSFGLYIHVPFCRELCSFCPYQKTTYNELLANRYLTALLQEISAAGKLHGRKKKVTSVYFGGGTPALLLKGLASIIETLHAEFLLEGPIGMELHPLDVQESVLDELRRIGFTMISLGIQSFQQECLDMLGRDYPADGALLIRRLKAAGFETIDVDLMFGLPGQTEAALRNDFLTAFSAGATQVSTYPFIDFSFANNSTKPLKRREKKRLLRCLEQTAEEADCSRTSVWTFSKGNNPKYSSITRDLYLGFGPSAVTLTYKVFQVNTFSVEAYIERIEQQVTTNNLKTNTTALTLSFSERTRALYWIFWNAYTLELNQTAFLSLFRRELDDVFRWELRFARMLGLLRKNGKSYRLTSRGTYLYHLLEQRYTHGYIDRTWKIARENEWPSHIRLY